MKVNQQLLLALGCLCILFSCTDSEKSEKWDGTMSFQVSDDFLLPTEFGHVLIHTKEGELLAYQEIFNSREIIFEVEEGSVFSYSVIKTNREFSWARVEINAYSVADINEKMDFVIHKSPKHELDLINGIHRTELDLSKSTTPLDFIQGSSPSGLMGTWRAPFSTTYPKFVNFIPTDGDYLFSGYSAAKGWRYRKESNLDVSEKLTMDFDQMTPFENILSWKVDKTLDIDFSIYLLEPFQNHYKPKLNIIWYYSPSDFSEAQSFSIPYFEKNLPYLTEFNTFLSRNRIFVNYKKTGSPTTVFPEIDKYIDFNVTGKSVSDFTVIMQTGSDYYTAYWTQKYWATNHDVITEWYVYGKSGVFKIDPLPEDITFRAEGLADLSNTYKFFITQNFGSMDYEKFIEKSHQGLDQKFDLEELGYMKKVVDKY